MNLNNKFSTIIIRFLFTLLIYCLNEENKSVILCKMTNDLKEKILKLHNDVRKSAMNCELNGQPKAENLPLLKWDEDLARTAENLAKKCRFGHDDPKVPSFTTVGQNWAGASTFERGFALWSEEYKHYDFFSGDCRTKACGHYTQIVWESTTHVGCGVQKCPAPSFGLSIVCNYGPAGNFVGQQPYRTVKNTLCNNNDNNMETDSDGQSDVDENNYYDAIQNKPSYQNHLNPFGAQAFSYDNPNENDDSLTVNEYYEQNQDEPTEFEFYDY